MRPRALISVTDKTGVVELAKGLSAHGYEIVSTGGTARTIREAGMQVLEVGELTGVPEMLGGRVKTLHPNVHAGLLADLGNPDHRRQLAHAGIAPISVLAVNLYPFEQTVSAPHEFEEAVESIDIGGPAMIRAAAKNHANVVVVVDPADYKELLAALDSSGFTCALRSRLAAKAFRHTAFYDSMVSRYLTAKAGHPLDDETLTVGLRRVQKFRYGENPHQTGALYADPLGAPGIAQAIQLWGKELSYNNVLDADGAWELAADLPHGSCAIIKHGNPCGAATGTSLGESYRWAKETDPVSAFGGVAAFHGHIDSAAAAAMAEKGNFLEVVIASGYDSDALEIFKERSGWGQDVRLLAAPLPTGAARLSLRSIGGGAIVQDCDEDPGGDWKTVTKRKPTDDEMRALRFLWIVVQHVKSNAIVVGTKSRMLGVGAGQMNRVQSVRLALEQAGPGAKGAALASDAFFPFPDSVEAAAAAGIAAVVQPGGSKKDPDVVAKADELGLAMVLTGVRHFRH